MGYGFNSEDQKTEALPDAKPSVTSEELKDAPKIPEVKAEKRKLPPEPPSEFIHLTVPQSSTVENISNLVTLISEWFDIDDEHNTKVYVTNLPLDITEAEFAELMQKCGLVMKDLNTGKMKVKLYTDPTSKELKGDALCTYIKVNMSPLNMILVLLCLIYA